MLNRISKQFDCDLDEPTSADSSSRRGPAGRLQGAMEAGVAKAGEFVARHPVMCIGAAAATGIAVGWWVKRK